MSWVLSNFAASQANKSVITPGMSRYTPRGVANLRRIKDQSDMKPGLREIDLIAMFRNTGRIHLPLFQTSLSCPCGFATPTRD
jgi:hypothetical protein